MMNNDIWIKITFNSKGKVVGKDKLIDELRKVCVVQERKLWYPSCDSGAEFFVEILLNSPIAGFIQNVVAPGLAWDVLKIGCSKIWEAFTKFKKENEGFDLQSLTLTFNDATVKVNGILGDNYLFLVRLFQSLPKHWAKFQKLGLKGVNKIELPLLPNDDCEELIEKYCTEDDNTPENCLWHIRYELGLESCYYSPALMKIVWS